MNRKTLLISQAFFIILIFSIYGQKIIENPSSPQNSKAGRIIQMKEILWIQDNPKHFIFKRPGHFKIGPDGSIYAKDEKALYRFSPQGEFLNNLYKKGEGPGELTYLFQYFINGNSIVLFNHYNAKVVIVNPEGKLKRQFYIPGKGMKLLLAVEGNTYYFRSLSPEEMEKRPKTGIGVITQYYRIYSWCEGDKQPRRSELVFPEKKHIISTSYGTSSLGISIIIVSNQMKHLIESYKQLTSNERKLLNKGILRHEFLIMLPNMGVKYFTNSYGNSRFIAVFGNQIKIQWKAIKRVNILNMKLLKFTWKNTEPIFKN